MIHRCPNCNRVIAKEDRRFKRQGTLRPLNGSTISEQPRQAPSVRCFKCNRRVILMKGTL